MIGRAALVALVCAGCTGVIDGPGAGPDDPVPPTDEPRGVCDGSEADVPGPRLIRRLTGAEVDATVRAALGFDQAAWGGAGLPADPAARNGFTNNADRLLVDDTYAARLRGAALAIGELAATAPHLTRLSPCSAVGDRACAESFLETVGRRLFRRPLTAAEKQRYLELYDRVTAEADYATWIRWATAGLVQSPNFVYRTELGEPDGGGGYRLTDFEVASALAYNLTGGPPDDALLDLAAAGQLSTPDEIEAAARALVFDDAGAVRPAARRVVLDFASRWLGLSPLANVAKSDALFPDFSPAIADSMRRETEAFLAAVIFDDRGGMAELLTSPVTEIDQTLAGYYGFGGAGAVERPDGWGVGLLAQGSLLAINAGNSHTSPTQRGLLVRERLLCDEMPPPPAVVGDLPEPTGAETTRQRYEEIHAGNDACAGCHQLFDPIGFAFEHLDASGRYRAAENGLPIDDSGYIAGLAGGDLAFTGPTELAVALADRPEPAVCTAAYLASYAYGLDHHDTPCLVTALADDLAAGEIGILDLWIGLAATPHFTARAD